MPDIVVRSPDHTIDICLILGEHARQVTVTIGISRRVGIDDIGTADQRHENAQFFLVNLVYTVYRGIDFCQRIIES